LPWRFGQDKSVLLPWICSSEGEAWGGSRLGAWFHNLWVGGHDSGAALDCVWLSRLHAAWKASSYLTGWSCAGYWRRNTVVLVMLLVKKSADVFKYALKNLRNIRLYCWSVQWLSSIKFGTHWLHSVGLMVFTLLIFLIYQTVEKPTGLMIPLLKYLYINMASKPKKQRGSTFTTKLKQKHKFLYKYWIPPFNSEATWRG
jgi:hypothetical protein